MAQQYDFMAKLSLKQQVETLAKGIELLEAWTGIAPMAHRSGGYSINEDTVKALKRVGIRLDSSMNASHPNSLLTWSRNQVVERDGIIELPVTLCNYMVGFRYGKRAAWFYKKLMKTDLDLLTLEEFRELVIVAQASDVRVLNLFMHSYSLLEFDYFFRKFAPQRLVRNKLERFLEEMTGRSDVRWLSCSEFLGRHEEEPDAFAGSDEVPDLMANRHVCKLALNSLRLKLLHRFGSPE